MDACEVHPAHIEGSRTVHLTAYSFVLEALCGQAIEFDGEPDGASICAECHALALESGGDSETWVVEVDVIGLRAAA